MHAGRTGKGRSLSGFLAALMLALALIPAEAVFVPAHAESDRPFISNFFQRLFNPSRQERKEQRLRQRDRQQQAAPRQKTRRKPAAQTAQPEQPEPAVVEKLENARKVLVVGDFLAGSLASGLETAFTETAGVLVVNKSLASSGIVRDDHYNWPATIGPMIDEVQPAVIVMMIGANDRQQMRAGDQKLRLRSEEWDKEYMARLAAFAGVAKDRRIPLVWIGALPQRVSSATSDMLALNDFFRAATEAAGGEFVDVWDGFADENGAFVTTGPDVNGQPVRLRGNDGVGVTKAGRRKLAFYAEKPLKRILGDAASPATTVLGPENLPSMTIDPVIGAPRLDRTAPMAITDPELDGGDELLGRVVEPASTLPDNPLPAQALAIKGIAPAATPGRADDFSVRKEQPAGTIEVPNGERTGAIR